MRLYGDIMKIEIFFYKGDDTLSKLIKWLTQKPYSHTGIIVGGLTVFDTDFTRDLSLRDLPWNKSDIDIITLNLSDAQYEDAINWIRGHNRIKYDNWENVRFILDYKKSNGVYKLNCVEATVDFLCSIGILNIIYRDDNISPGDLFNLLNGRI